METQRRVLAGKGRDIVIANSKFACALLALICIALGAAPEHASAITADIARKCNALTAKQFPPREPGNPAAGSAKGSGRTQHEYFNKCVANGGKVDDNTVPK
jgi:hypothetical protein